MAYGSYYPQNFYPQFYGSQQMAQNAPQNAQQAQSNGILWVQGEAAAKAYPVASGQSVLLMDSEDSVMYIKSTDQSGMPQPLRVFDYKERNTMHGEAPAVKNINTEEFVSRKEFEAFRDDVKKLMKGVGRKPKTEEEEGDK